MKLACIVEGHGEVDAVPVLIQRILSARAPGAAVDLLRPCHRVPRGKLAKGDEIERAVRFQAKRVGADGGILILLDADDDCAATLGPELQSRAGVPGVRVGVVIAVRMYEAWLAASARALAGARGLPPDLEPPVDPEGLKNPKAWLRKQTGGAYSETVDQAKLTARLEVEQALVARSFRKLVRELSRVLAIDLG